MRFHLPPTRIALLVIGSALFLSACGADATPTVAPAPTLAPPTAAATDTTLATAPPTMPTLAATDTTAAAPTTAATMVATVAPTDVATMAATSTVAPVAPTIMATASAAPAAPTTAPVTEATSTLAPTTAATEVFPTLAPGTTATPVPQAAAPTPAGSGGSAKTALTLKPVSVEATDGGALAQQHTINLPAGFHIKVFASGLPDVRWLGLSPDGLVYATMPNSGKVVTLPDANKDGVADSTKTFASDLSGVHGIAFHDGAVYVATVRQIVKLQDTTGSGVADQKTVLVSDLPVGSDHVTRTLLFSADGSRLFVAAGSSCNVCVQTDSSAAAISLYSPDGTFQQTWAKGLRNAVGLVLQPGTNTMWATNNGRDSLGDNIPPETIYNVQQGADYGFPYCYDTQTPDKTQNPPAGYCAKTGVPAVEMQAHSAPLGLAFYNGAQFPAQFQGDLFVAFHGSWNRSVPTGYKLVRVRFTNHQPDKAAGDQEVEDFATGWMAGGAVWGRPVDPLVLPNGSLLLTDDKAGVIYDIYYAAP